MKKDLDKLFSKSIETYYFLLLIVVIIKLLGGNYFEIVYTNRTINMINDFILYWRLENIWYAITLYVNVYITLSVTCNDDSEKIKKYTFYLLPLICLIQFSKNYTSFFALIIDFVYVYILALIYLKYNHIKIQKQTIFNYLGITFLTIFAQIFSMIIRNQNLLNVTNNFYITFILNIDYFLIIIIIYKLYFMKGGISLCQTVAYSGLQKLTSLKNSLKKLQAQLQKKTTKKSKDKKEKITYAIFLPLYILWNLFTMCVIIAIAFLNDAFIEAIFITVAFWVNKYAFGKPFHFKSVAICFAFSSFTYYVLTRITFKTETSFFIPIFLGVALSYVTSHFIKKNIKLYRGMSKEELYEIVMAIEDDPIVLKILQQYYCDRLNDVQIARNVNYSIDSIRKKRQNVNKKLRNS